MQDAEIPRPGPARAIPNLPPKQDQDFPPPASVSDYATRMLKAQTECYTAYLFPHRTILGHSSHARRILSQN